MNNVRHYDPQDPIKCLETHLKTLVLKNYKGDKQDVSFAKFFVLNAKLLESMELRLKDNTFTMRSETNQRRRLQLDNRASRGARFYFKRDLDIRSFCNDYRLHGM